MTTEKTPTIEGLDEALEEFRFSPETYAHPKIKAVYEAAQLYQASQKGAVTDTRPDCSDVDYMSANRVSGAEAELKKLQRCAYTFGTYFASGDATGEYNNALILLNEIIRARLADQKEG